MATRKTSAGKELKTLSEDSKKNSTPSKPAAMAKPVKKRVVKKDDALQNKPADDTEVLHKANINPLDKVMEIKAHNEEIKAAKALKKGAKKNVKTLKASELSQTVSSVEEEKGAKTLADTKKRRNVINGAQKTAERKFAELKAEENNEESSCACCCTSFCNGAFGAWANVYKNIFNFKGRTSRFEFWSFMLINFFVTLAFLGGVFLLPYEVLESSETIVGSIMIAFMVIQGVINLSLSVRRIHDTGNTAWKGFYLPFVCVLALMFALGFVSNYYLPDENYLWESDDAVFLSALGILITFLILFVFYLYYLFKIFITVCFVEEDNSVLESGEARYVDTLHKKRAMRYAAIYFVIMMFLSFFSVAFLQFYLHYGCDVI